MLNRSAFDEYKKNLISTLSPFNTNTLIRDAIIFITALSYESDRSVEGYRLCQFVMTNLNEQLQKAELGMFSRHPFFTVYPHLSAALTKALESSCNQYEQAKVEFNNQLYEQSEEGADSKIRLQR